MRREHLADEGRSLGVLLREQPRTVLHERHSHPEPREGLRQLATNRGAAEHEQRVRARVERVEDRSFVKNGTLPSARRPECRWR